MEAIEFKNNLKIVKESLRGLKISFSTKYASRCYTSLNSFGNAVLEQEQYGLHFGINNVKTSEGLIPINSFLQLLDVLKTQVVEVVQFCSYREYTGMGDLVRSGSLD